MNYLASVELFNSGNLLLYIPAATLGHHALEMYLKAALICQGMTVFNPKMLQFLDPTVGLTEANCIWGHMLVDLASQLSIKRDDFDLRLELGLADSPGVSMPKTLRTGLELFDPFFSELRYPRELKKLESVGEAEKTVLDRLVAVLRPFAGDVPSRSD
jgi:hypothetical protein